MTTENAEDKSRLRASFKLSRAELFTLLGAVFGVLPIALCSMRVMVLARGDYNSLRMLVQNLDVKALVLATLLPIGGTILFWTQFAIFIFAAAKDTSEQYKRLLVTWFICLLPITIIALWAATSKRQLVINIVILVVFLSAIVVGSWTQGALRTLLVWLCALAMVGGLLWGFVSVVTQSDLWVPFERIALEGGSVVEGYVLSVDEEWTRYMDSRDRSIHIVHTDKVKTRDLIDR